MPQSWPEGTAPSQEPPAHEEFTQLDLDAVEALTRLSGSSMSTDEGGASTASGSSFPCSVNAPPAPALTPARELALPGGTGAGGDADEEEDEHEVAGSQRRMKRCRPIAEIYHATARFATFAIKNKKK
ncbi:hypothetical protein BAE44_0019723 [Dichanthelium oligosanthes]|uniref:Uncharacterized protein n=1 Tax=Dichanthelium oligosanthes TaxID=888268 RepID=A0A1E5V264_9POAL|nr:hypothetical protein BAE44_0019723 [Dichanthelium oligosanthes]